MNWNSLHSCLIFWFSCLCKNEGSFNLLFSLDGGKIKARLFLKYCTEKLSILCQVFRSRMTCLTYSMHEQYFFRLKPPVPTYTLIWNNTSVVFHIISSTSGWKCLHPLPKHSQRIIRKSLNSVVQIMTQIWPDEFNIHSYLFNNYYCKFTKVWVLGRLL